MTSRIESVNDFVIKFANVNGSGSASANTLFAKSILRMGVPVSPRNIFPSNIQGLPTWYEVRVSESGWLGRRGGTVLEFRWLAEAAKRVLGQVKQPALIFHPRFDDQSDISNTMMLQRRLGGLTEVVVLDDSYHMVTLDRQRAVVVEKSLVFTDWIARQFQDSLEIERIKQNAASE